MSTHDETGTPAGAAAALRRRIWLRFGALAVVLIGGYVAVALWQGDRIAPSTTVAGVEVGGLSEQDAADRLSAESTRLAALPVTVTVGDDRVELTPSTAGLRLNVEKSLAGLSTGGFAPGKVFGYFTGGTKRAGVVSADPAKIADALERSSASVLSAAPVDGKVSFENGQVEVVRSKPGQGFDVDAVAQEIAGQWPTKRQYAAELSEREGRLTNAEIDRFVRDFANPAMSGDLRLTSGDQTARLTPLQLSGVLSVKNASGNLAPDLDVDKLSEVVLAQKPGLVRPATNAKVTLSGGTPQITPSADGTQLDQAKLGPAVIAALTATDRTVTVPTTTLKAKVTTEEVKSLKTGTVISQFRSRFPTGASNAARTKNIGIALSILNGQVVPAGEQFSLIQALGGQMTAAQGYVPAPTIQGGRERAAMGGGVSQVSTIVYNTAFFAGVRLDEHKAHSFWIERYPMGREATIWIPDIDNKWTNTTGEAILIQAGIEGNEAVMRFYGKKTFTVETATGEPYRYTQPKRIYDPHPGCIRVPPQRGFTVQVTRVIKQGGAVLRNEKITTTYQAANDIVCSNG